MAEQITTTDPAESAAQNTKSGSDKVGGAEIRSF
jgi:hypothetical protein